MRKTLLSLLLLCVSIFTAQAQNTDITQFADVLYIKDSSAQPGDQIVMTRKLFVHHDNNYSSPNICFCFDNNQLLIIGYWHSDYWGGWDGSIEGIHIMTAPASPSEDPYSVDWPSMLTKDWYVGSNILDEWFTEKLVINKDGRVQYFLNDNLMGEEVFDELKLHEASSFKIQMCPYGWWTGHYTYMDDFHLSAPATTLSDDFNDGVINLDIWRTPVNPDGVREEGGIIKMEQLRTDDNFCLNIDYIPLWNGPFSYLNCPDDNHPHMIDLGLPSGTKWACCNVGATTPEDYGDYYAWGETETKSSYGWATYDHCDGSYETCHDLGADIAGTQYDVAHVKWGGNWVMPSLDQINELINNCSWDWTTESGVNGRKFTSTNGCSIFLPAAGYRGASGLSLAGSRSYYWSSTQNPSYSNYAYSLYFHSGGIRSNDYTRCSGFSVRPVCTRIIKPSTIRGDVDGDKAINIRDIMMVVTHILGGYNDVFLERNADVDNDGEISVADVVEMVSIILTGKGASSVELPEEAGIDVSDLTIYSDGEQVDVGENGTLGACIGDMMAFNGDSLVYLSYGSQSDDRTLNSLETAISLLLPIIPFAVTDMDDDSFWLLKLMIGRLEQTRDLADAIDQSIIDKGYLDMEAVNPQYLAAVSELQERLGIDGEEPAYSRMKKTKKTTYPFFIYGDKEAYGDGFTLIKDHTLWGPGKDGDCWNCEFTILNSGRWCYTSLTKMRKNESGMFNRLDDGITDTFTNLIKPNNIGSLMDFGLFSDLATNPKDFLITLSDHDIDRLISYLWDPLKNFGHIIRGEDTETVTFDKIKKSGIMLELYPDNEHLGIVGPGLDAKLMLFNFIKVAFQPVMKLVMKEVVKTEGYEKSDLMDKFFVQFVKFIVEEVDPTFCTTLMATINDSSIPWYKRIVTVYDDINEKLAMFMVEDVIVKYFSEAIYKNVFTNLAKGYNNPTIKALFTSYKIMLTAGNILQLMLDSDYEGVAFEMDYGPSYDSFHERKIENFTIGDVTFTMMTLPGGPFMMGAENDDEQADGSEKPLHYVNLSKFAIGETEVTQGLWKAVMGSNPSKFQNNNRPVENVSWLDCQEFIEKLNQLAANQLKGRHFRLPTEAEWEFAACGGMYKRGYPYAGGDKIDDVAWFKGNCSKTQPVRLKKANEFGLYDMSGNVMEWCQDFYDAHYYDNAPEDNPCNDVTATLYAHVLRGGNWHWDDKYCRVTSRTNNGQGVKAEIYGLRLALDVSNDNTSYLTCPDDNHPHLIDLGLPSGTKWACCNVDDDHTKQSPSNFGSYYAWGETQEKDYYYWDSYTHCDGSGSTCHDLGSDIAGTQYDVAHVQWGGSWVMPSQTQTNELLENCSYKWKNLNGVYGYQFTSSNGGTIFLPASGGRISGYSLYYDGVDGGPWSSTQNPSNSYEAYNLRLVSSRFVWNSNFRCCGLTVRPVSR